MKARAPGKLVLSGAYAVIEGAPAIVLAVDRFAIADAATPAVSPSAEVRELFGDHAPACDVAALYAPDGSKLGLGSSAAAVVASLGAACLVEGQSLEDAGVRKNIFERARAAHARVQGGGSGVDVAASTYGGVLRYAVSSATAATIQPIALPADFVWRAYFSGRSARTSDLRARVEAFRSASPAAHRARMTDLGALAERTVTAVTQSGERLVHALADFGESLIRLGEAADVPIVTPAFLRLAKAAVAEGGAFLPAGAGGGDVGTFCGTRPPSAAFDQMARELVMTSLSLSVAPEGVSRISPVFPLPLAPAVSSS